MTSKNKELTPQSLATIKKALIKKLITPEQAQDMINVLTNNLTREQWAHKYFYINGKPFSLVGREYLKEIFEMTGKIDIVVKKSSQCGVSELAVVFAFHFADVIKENVFYAFPSSDAIGPFVQSRIDPRIEANEELRVKFQKTDNKKLKQLGSAFIFLRGTTTKTQIKTADVEFLILDEVDEMVPDNADELNKRLGDTRLKLYRWKLKLSTPTFSGYGIDKEYNMSDQREWHIKCDRCQKSQVLDFFENIHPKPTRDMNYVLREKPYYICKFCKKPINNNKTGVWIAKYPEKEVRGYHISKLFIETAEVLWKEYRDTRNLAIFFNHDLGLAYSPEGGKLSPADIDACIDDKDIALSNGVYMGIDVGRYLHVVISKKFYGKYYRIYVNAVKDFEELDILMKQFDVNNCVIDALPETRQVRAFRDKFRGRVFMAFYTLHDKSQTALFDREKGIVKINRTNAMDYSANNILTRVTRFRSTIKENREFYSNMIAPIKTEIKDEKTGNIEYKYLEGSNPDHYYHANTYCDVATISNSPVSVDGEKTVIIGNEDDEDFIDDYIDDFGSNY